MKLGHAHIKVRDLDRSVEFYTTLFDLEITERVGEKFAFLTGGGMHHELALQAVGEDARTPGPGTVGLFHIAFEVPDKQVFARKYQQLKERGIQPFTIDHLISWALYFDDPDGNGLEIYVDTREQREGKKSWKGMNRALPEKKILAVLE
ncbi:MAG: VOC family protein [Balneolaceae bacterium]|nr:VOC family protein [Balneolaceae bacterium]